MTYKNLAYGLVATAPSPATSGTSLVLGSGEGARFPAPATDGSFYVTIFPIAADPTPATAEICQVTARTTDTLTIVRAQKSTSARTVIVGDRVIQGIYAEDIGLTSMVRNEVPGGSVNSSNTAFTVVGSYQTGSLRVYQNGIRLKAGGVDFTEVAGGFTAVTAPITGDLLLVDYETNSNSMAIGTNSFVTNETPSGLVNSSNTAYDTASAYVAGSIQVYRDGQLMKGGGADYTETDSNTITFTTAPVTGSVLLVSYQHAVAASANADTLDGYHANATPTANNIPVLDANLDIWSGGWRALGAVTYEGADAPTYTISFASDMTAILGVGMRIKLTDSTVKCFIITAVGAYSGGKTIITVYGGTDYTLSGGAISAPYYSRDKAPLGFPTSPIKWTARTTDTSSRSQATPTQNVWYNAGTTNSQLSIPIGCWRVYYKVSGDIAKSSNAANTVYVTLSTANNSESDAELTTFQGLNPSITENYLLHTASKALLVASKTLYYLNIKTDQTNVSSLAFRGDIGTTIVEAVCSYL